VKFMLLINLGPKARDYKSLTEDEQKAIAAGYKAINETPGVTPGEGLAPPESATTVRRDNGKTQTSKGPFVESKEALDGYCFYEADDLDAAIELASRIPAVEMGGAVEVRPIAEW
jgi:hypothetical protein